MSAYTLALIFAACAIPAFFGMWVAWRARARRDAVLLAAAPLPSGAFIAEFTGVGYVSTTPVDRPLERIALPGLRYKGVSSIAVRVDGVTITVTGEQPVGIAAENIIGSGTTNGRIGKTVERDGLSLLRWRTPPAAPEAIELESSFRFTGAAEQQRFAEAVAELIGPGDALAGAELSQQTSFLSHHTTQEDA